MPDTAEPDLSANKIFVFGLRAENKAEVKAYFEVYGTVLALKPLRHDCRLYGWPSSGAGFVTFKSAQAAQAALHDGGERPTPLSGPLWVCKPKAKKTVSKHNTAALMANTSSRRNKRRLGYWQRHSSNDAKPCILADVICEAPKLLDFLPPESWSALSGCSRQLRRLVHNHTQIIHIDHCTHLLALSEGTWPRLSMVKYKTDERNFCSGQLLKGKLQLLAGLELSLKKEYDWSPSVIFAVRTKPAQHTASAPAMLTPTVLDCLQQPKWSDLEQLSLKDSKLSLAGLRQLVAIKWPKLHRLNVARNALGPEGIAELLLGVWPELRVLDVSENKLDLTAMEHLVRGQWPSLMELRLNGNGDLNAAACACLQTAKWPVMHQLHIADIQLDNTCVRELAQIKWKLLHWLSLRSAGMTSDAFTELVQADWRCLRYLNLSHNQLGTTAIAKLVEMQLPILEYLGLEDNRLDAVAIKHLAKGQWPMLSYLVLTDNYLDDAAVLHLSHGQWPTLQTLGLRSNNITALGIEFLLSGNWVLNQLELGRAAISAKTWGLLSLDVEQLIHVAELTEHEPVNVSRAAVLGSDESLIWPSLTKVSFHAHLGNKRKDGSVRKLTNDRC